MAKSNMNPSKEYPGISKPMKIKVGTRRKIIPNFQQEIFDPSKVWNSNSALKFLARGRDSQIRRIIFPLCKDHFSYKPTKWISDKNYTLKKPFPTPGSIYCFVAGLSNWFVSFIPFYLVVITQNPKLPKIKGKILVNKIS